MSKLFPVFTVFALLSLSHPCAAQTRSTAPVGLPGAPSIAARLTYSQALLQVQSKFNINILTDSFPGETGQFAPDTLQGDIPTLLRQIAAKSDRNLVVLDGIYVFRHKRWAKQRAQFAEPGWQQYRNDTTGSLLYDKLKAVATPVSDPVTEAAAQTVSVQGVDVTCRQIVRGLQPQIEARLKLDPIVDKVRVHVLVSDVTPAALMNSLAYVAVAGPTLDLTRTQAQKDAEDDDTILPGDAARSRASRKLRAVLEKQLTDEQKKTLENGDFVEMRAGTLPKELQTQVLDYVHLGAKLQGEPVPALNMLKWQNFGIRFAPQRAGLAWKTLDIIAVGNDGTEYFF